VQIQAPLAQVHWESPNVHIWFMRHALPGAGLMKGQSMLEQHTHVQVPLVQAHPATP
jgi:hypothetical protein